MKTLLKKLSDSKEFVHKIAEHKLVYITKVKPSERPLVNNSQSANFIMHQFIDHDTIDAYESIYCMFFNHSLKLLSIKCISSGGINSTLCDIRMVFQHALLLNATRFTMVHNHPSGAIVPSKEDISLTKKLKDAGDLLDIKIVDHLIITSNPNSYYSFADEGQL